MSLSKKIDEAKDVVACHYPDGSNAINVFYNTKTTKVWANNSRGVNVALSNLMFSVRGSYAENSELLRETIRVVEPQNDKEMAECVGEVTELDDLIKPGSVKSR